MLKLGYKASAEQFAPSKLLAFSVVAEQVGFDSVFVSDHFQPWKHTDGHAPNALVWLGALGASHQAGHHRHVRADADVPLPSRRSWRRPSARWAAMFPDRVVLGVGTGESLNEVPSTRHEMARAQGTLRPPARGQSVDPQAVVRGPRHASRVEYYQTEKATIYDKPEKPVPIYVAAAGPQIAKYAGRIGRRVHLHVGQGVGALHRDAAAERRGGCWR